VKLEMYGFIEYGESNVFKEPNSVVDVFRSCRDGVIRSQSKEDQRFRFSEQQMTHRPPFAPHLLIAIGDRR